MQICASSNLQLYKRITDRLSDKKVEKWIGLMKEASTKRNMCQGLGAKWVGRLSFSIQRAFNRVGKAMTRPFIEQQHAPNKGNIISKKLRLAMR